VRVVWAGGPAGRAGVNAGDVIQGVGNSLVQNVCDVRSAVEKQGCGDVRLTVRRGKDTLALDARLVDAARFKRKKGDCQSGDGAACTALAKAHGNDIVLLRQACDLGDGDGCYRLGLELGNTAEGAAAYVQACDAGNPLACTNIGWMVQNGAGARVDLEAAVRLYKRGCDGSACSGRNDLGCLNLGRLYRDGVGVKQDDERAMSLFQFVCDYGTDAAARACSLAGTTLLFSKNLQHDVGGALALLEKGCNAGDTFGCFNLGAIYETGDDVPKDPRRAATYYQRACDGGDAEGCQRRQLLKF
jgi:TPR repeat protein